MARARRFDAVNRPSAMTMGYRSSSRTLSMIACVLMVARSWSIFRTTGSRVRPCEAGQSRELDHARCDYRAATDQQDPAKVEMRSCRCDRLGWNRIQNLLCVAHPKPRRTGFEHRHGILAIEDAAAGLEAQGRPDRGPNQGDVMERRTVPKITG